MFEIGRGSFDSLQKKLKIEYHKRAFGITRFIIPSQQGYRMIRSDNNNIREKFPAMIFALTVSVVVLAPVPDVTAAECASSTYSQQSFDNPQAAFSPYEKIFVRIHCGGLDAGDHTLYVNWVHARVGIVRSDKQNFSIGAAGADHTAYFWFKLSRLGPIKSVITNRDFFPDHLGNWAVEVSLDERPATSSSFSITESN